MKISIRGGEPIDCVEGSILTRNYNETLDSANIRIAHQKELLDIEPYDYVLLMFESDLFDDIPMLVNDIDIIEEGLDPIYYTYDISLFSMTKKLENIRLPNIAITPNGENRTIYYYLQQYLEEYGESSWQLSQGAEMLKLNVPCPEMQWNTPTLREVFDDLMMVVDCICVFSGTSVISCYDLTKKGTVVANYNYIKRSRSSQDYVSEIRMDLQNAMEDGSTIRTEIIPFSAASGYVLTSLNFTIKTQYPIRNINHLWMNFIDISDNNYIRVRVDLMTFLDGPLVLENDAYQLLETLYFTVGSGIPIDRNIWKYQNFVLYYNRYSNVISGLTDRLSTMFTADETKIQVIYDLFCREILGHTANISNNVFFSSLFFEVEYETTADLVFSASKLYEPRNKRVITDNQTNSFVNTKVQSDLEYQKANRLGNEQLMINQRVSDIGNAIKLAQIHKDSIVYQVQYQIYSDHVEVNALATKDYILRNYFTGIKSHIRTWVNAKDEALVRHELLKERYVLSYNAPESAQDNRIFLNVALYGGNAKKARYCVLIPKGIADLKYFTVDCIARVLANSIAFTFGCNDNATVYTYYDYSKITNNDITVMPTPKLKESFTSGFFDDGNHVGGVPLKAYRYVDDNFENTGVIFYITDESRRISDTLTSDQGNYQIYTFDDSTFAPTAAYMEALYMSPIRVNLPSGNTIRGETNFHKDNKEISKYTYQVEFGVDDLENLYLSQLFVERQQYVSDEIISAPVFYKADILRSDLPNSAVSLNATITLNPSAINNVFVISFAEDDVKIGEVIYLCDSSNNVIMAIRFTEDSTHRIVSGTVNLFMYLNKKE